MSQLSLARGTKGGAAGDGAKREWEPGMLPNPTTCRDVPQVLLPLSWALGTLALGLSQVSPGVSGVPVCAAEQDQGLFLQPCCVCVGLGWTQRAWLAVGH